MKIVFWPSIAGAEIGARLRTIAGARVVTVADLAQLAAALPDAGVMVAGGHHFSAQAARLLRERGNALRFIQTWTAGYEGLQQHGVPPGVIVANAGSAWSRIVAEHGVALLLALVRRLEPAIVNKPRHAWNRAQTATISSLEDMTLLIVGFGGIGREFARLVRPFGSHIVALRRSPQPDSLADEVLPIAQLDTVLPRADAILIAMPHDRSTDKLLGAAQFAVCKPGALVVNVARGALIDQQAFAAALASGRLGGAAVDVTDPEPLPENDPFWSAPNLIITPHLAGAGGPASRNRLAEHIGANVERFIAGQPVTSIVTLQTKEAP